MRFDANAPFPGEWKNRLGHVNTAIYCGRSKYLLMCVVRHLDLQRHCGIDQRLVKRVVYVNFKRHFDARLELGCGFEADFKIAFTFYCC